MQFTNWMGNVTSSPLSISYPTTEIDVVQIVQRAVAAGHRVRVVGSGHSWTPLVATDETLVSLDNMQGIIAINASKQTARVKAGTKIRTLAQGLLAQGWSLENFGDIDRQSIVGAMITGTHGTGLTFGCLATQAVAFRLVTASGAIIEVNKSEDAPLFRHVQISLGLLGIVTEVTLRIVPAHRLHVVRRRAQLEDVLCDLGAYLTNRHFQMYWFPGTQSVLTESMNMTDRPVNHGGIRRWFHDDVQGKYAPWTICQLVARVPELAGWFSRLSGRTIRGSEFSDVNYQILVSERPIKFYDMEYSFPLSRFGDVIRCMQAAMKEKGLTENFPTVCRFTQSDDISLSPANGRDSAHISVHSCGQRPYPHYLAEMERVFSEFGGRPHWAKFHSQGLPELLRLFPQLNSFLTVRSQMDPDGRFFNSYLRDLLELEPGE